MPKSKKPKAKRAAAKPVQKPVWYQELNNSAGQQRSRPLMTGKKAQNKSA
jgi:hypothetical protein